MLPREPLDGLEQAEQPGLPQAAVQPARGRRGRSGRGAIAKICNAVVQGIKSVQRTSRSRAAQPGRAGTNSPNSSWPSVSPLPFLRAMKAGGAKGFDAYAHHPYYGSPARRRRPSRPRAARAAADRRHIGQHRPSDRRARPALREEDARLDHRVRVPDEPSRRDLRRDVVEAGEVPHAKAVAIAHARTRGSTCSSGSCFATRSASEVAVGLTTVDGRRKPSFDAFRRASLARRPVDSERGEGLRGGPRPRRPSVVARSWRRSMTSRRLRPPGGRGLDAGGCGTPLPRLGGRGRRRMAIVGRGVRASASCAVRSEADVGV